MTRLCFWDHQIVSDAVSKILRYLNPVSIRSQVSTKCWLVTGKGILESQSRINPVSSFHKSTWKFNSILLSSLNPVSIRSQVSTEGWEIKAGEIIRVSIPYQSGLKFPQKKRKGFADYPGCLNPVSIRSQVSTILRENVLNKVKMMSQSRINPVSSFHFNPVITKENLDKLSQSRINPVSSFHFNPVITKENLDKLSQSRINPVSSFHSGPFFAFENRYLSTHFRKPAIWAYL